MSKIKRVYDSKKRQVGAELTREEILRTAERLFTKKGIDRVSIQELAAEAGVSTPTVYQIFKSKAGLLGRMMEGALFDAKSINLSTAVDRLNDPKKIIEMTAEIAATIYRNERNVLGFIRGVSAFYPELRDAEKRFENIRFKAQRERCENLSKMKALTPGVTVFQARQVMWMYTSRDIFRMLVIEQKWSVTKYKKRIGITKRICPGIKDAFTCPAA